MHEEQIMLLQAMGSLISIKESDKKENKSSTRDYSKNVSFITYNRKQNLAQMKKHQSGGGNTEDAFSVPYALAIHKDSEKKEGLRVHRTPNMIRDNIEQ